MRQVGKWLANPKCQRKSPNFSHFGAIQILELELVAPHPRPQQPTKRQKVAISK
jgi:hypothetical protein